MNNQETIKVKKFKMPDTAALMMIIILVVAALTFIVPAGEYDRVYDEEANRTMIVEGTYERIEQSPVSFVQLFSSPYRGLMEATHIISIILICGGAFGIIANTNAVTAGIERLLIKFPGKQKLLLVALMILFALAGASFGFSEEVLVFTPMMVVVCAAMGYDAIIAVSVVLIGTYCGYSAGVVNIWNVGVAQSIAELPIFSGLTLRAVLMAGTLIIAMLHTNNYSNRNKLRSNTDIKIEAEYEFTKERKWTIVVMVATIVLIAVGMLKFGWYFDEMAAIFMVMGIIVGLINYKSNISRIAKEFTDGAKELVYAAILIGFARGIYLVLQDGQILDTIIYAISIPLKSLNSPLISAWTMYFLQGLLNIVIPSSSGQAFVSMPIMVPLADMVGVTRQTAVMAFAAGDGFWNLITPAHAVTMGTIALAGISFQKWFKYMLPLILKWSIWIMVVLAIAVFTNYGPF